MLVGSERRRSIGRVGNLGSRTKSRWLVDSGGASDRGRVGSELLKGLGDDSGSGKADLTGDVVDGDGEPEKLRGVFFNCECVVKLLTADEIFGACRVLKLNAEVIVDESEGDAVGGMPEETNGASLVIAVLGEACDEDILRDLAGVR